MHRRWLRWAPPAATVGAVAAYAAVPAILATGTVRPQLPAISAARLIARVEAAHVAGLSGRISENADLGLPDLPVSDGDTVTGLLSGRHTLTLAAAGTDRERITVVDRLAETSVVRDGDVISTYASATGSSTQTTAPLQTLAQTGAGALTPQSAAARALASVGADTAVSVAATTRIAGHDAYTLVLTPRSVGTLVGRVEIGVDAVTFVPLRTTVYARTGGSPAFDSHFTSLSYGVPPASTFRIDVAPTGQLATTPLLTALVLARRAGVHTVGSGWATVAIVDGLRLPASVGPTVAALSTPVPAGRLITTRLLTALITPGGEIYVGAVPPSTLEADAAR